MRPQSVFLAQTGCPVSTLLHATSGGRALTLAAINMIFFGIAPVAIALAARGPQA